MATTQLEVLALWTRARHTADAETRRDCLSEAEQLILTEPDPREQQFARRVLEHFQRWMELRSPNDKTSRREPTSPGPQARSGRYRLAPADWSVR
jgi:hypothetical protein